MLTRVFVGVQLFAGIRHGKFIGMTYNFDSVANALLLLFRILTGMRSVFCYYLVLCIHTCFGGGRRGLE